ncbi:MAG: FAD-dependent monooxygenase [Solirubrobacteraceae bacterium]
MIEHRYDVAVLGGGLAGLTLALQLKSRGPETSILVVERREGPAPEAAFKVGESTVEVGADYFARVCGMRDHLEREQLPKLGLRFFFSAGDNRDITKRIEWGERAFPSGARTYQIDRGRFENALADRCRELGVELREGASVIEVDLVGDPHTVTVSRASGEETVHARWVVDCAGRAFILRRKLGLQQDVAHTVNSAWWRVGNGHVDLEEWGAHDEEWMARMARPGLRQHSTCHLCGEGYWVWLIPLASKGHSIGIVADPRFHAFERIATLDRALEWLAEFEPQLADALARRRSDVQDFLTIEKFAHGCTQVFSPDRWTLTGEAGVFIDPLYSPGSDYIAGANTYATDLICRDLAGEDITDVAARYNFAYLAQFQGSLDAVWTGHYAEFGDAEVLNCKLTYDYIRYWGLVAPFELYDKYTDATFTLAVLPDVMRGVRLGGVVQQLFRDWHVAGQGEPHPSNAMVVVSTFPGCWQLYTDLTVGLDDGGLREHFRRGADVLEGAAVVYFHRACRRLADGPPDPARRVNPYAVSLHPDRWDAEELFSEDGLTLAQAHERAPGLDNVMLGELAGGAALS